MAAKTSSAPQTDGRLSQLIERFQSIAGQKALEIHWAQGKIVTQIFDEWGGESGHGFNELQRRTGLSRDYLWGVYRFARHLPPKKWVRELTYEHHRVVAWHFHIARLRRQMKAEQPLEHWLQSAAKNGWGVQQLEERVSAYFGSLESIAQVVFLKTKLEEQTGEPVQLHPRVEREIKEAEQRVADRALKRSTRVQPKPLLHAKFLLERVRSLQQTLKQDARLGERGVLERDDLDEALRQLGRSIGDLLRTIEHRRPNWGPGEVCLQCGSKNHPHKGIGYCTVCYDNLLKQRQQNIVAHAKRVYGKSNRRSRS